MRRRTYGSAKTAVVKDCFFALASSTFAVVLEVFLVLVGLTVALVDVLHRAQIFTALLMYTSASARTAISQARCNFTGTSDNLIDFIGLGLNFLQLTLELL